MKMIVAKDLNGAIGKDNGLPWRLSWDIQNFRRITTGGTILMGRKTYESIGRPLPNRRNIVMTKDKGLVIPGVEIVHDLYDALALDDSLFVIGGESLYRLAMPLVQTLHMTIVQTHIDGADTYFPCEDLYDWITVEHESHHKDEKNQFACTYYKLIRQ